MAECIKCVYEKDCPRLKQQKQLSGDDTTHRLLVSFFGCHAFEERKNDNENRYF